MKTNKLAVGILFLVACGSEVVPKHQTESSPPTATALTVKNDAGTAVAAKTDSTTVTPATTTPAATVATEVLRHLPGTAVKLAGNATIYMVTDVGTLSPFANATALHTSGYSDAMVVTITAAEFSCYGTGKTIKSSLPAPAAGHVRDGTLVKESNRSTVYAVSDGVAWSIFNQNVYTDSGYKDATVEIIAAGTIANIVDEVGNCSLGVACLDMDYISSCAKDDLGGITIDPGSGDDTDTSVDTSVATGAGTSVATSVNTSVATSVATTAATSAATSVATSTPVQTQSTGSTQTNAVTQTNASTQTTAVTQTNPQTAAGTSAATAVQTSTPTAVATNTNTGTVTVATTNTATAVTVSSVNSGTATATQAATQPAATTTTTATTATAPGTWVWVGDGAKICLNAVYFMPQSATRAVLRTWSGPYITGTNSGPVTGKDDQNRFCWDFTGMQAGVYTFWADVPAASCAATDFCGDDGIAGDGAQYGLATNATAAEHKWLQCVPATGCDGYAAFNGTAWLAGNP